MSQVDRSMLARLNDVNEAEAALRELGIPAGQARAMVEARLAIGWTPEQQAALRRFCDAANAQLLGVAVSARSRRQRTLTADRS